MTKVRSRLWTVPCLLAAATLAGLALAMISGATWVRAIAWMLLLAPLVTLALKLRRA